MAALHLANLYSNNESQHPLSISNFGYTYQAEKSLKEKGE
jgi:hypothetical protein